ncbi:MAG: leucine-rich repeat domain-containing protein [Proteobacteria bacterium]|nr:leucine-rich repeat domain-containing protein [Pseudomonadota bacterium]
MSINLKSTKLDLNSKQITRIPESLFTIRKYQDFWKKVRTIDCSNNKLRSLPEGLGNRCLALQAFHCLSNLLECLPQSLSNCLALEDLNIQSNQLRELPEFIGKFQNLSDLDCGDNKLKDLPESLTNCKALKSLDCENNQLQALPKSLGQLKNLATLRCGLNELRSLPESLGECRNMEELSIIGSKLQILPEYFGNFQMLQELDCNDCQLQTLPASLAHCQALVSIACCYNQLQALPDFLGTFQQLDSIHCGNNQLQTLPESLGNCQALTKLYCNQNRLKNLPESLGNCQALNQLDCSQNNLEALPESLGNCQRLKELRCSQNALKTLPESLSHCRNLKAIRCAGNYISSFPKALIAKAGKKWCDRTLSKQKKLANVTNNIIALKVDKSPSPQPLEKQPPEANQSLGTTHKAWLKLIYLTTFASLTLISYIIAASLLKAGTILATKAAIGAISLFSGLAITSALFGLYYFSVALKATIVRYIQNSARCIEARSACDEQLAQLTKNFSTNSVETFINPLKDMENHVPRPLLLKFKELEIKHCKKVLALNGKERNQAKEHAFAELRKAIQTF